MIRNQGRPTGWFVGSLCLIGSLATSGAARGQFFIDPSAVPPRPAGVPALFDGFSIDLNTNPPTAISFTVELAGGESKKEKGDKIASAMLANGVNASVDAAGNVKVNGSLAGAAATGVTWSNGSGEALNITQAPAAVGIRAELGFEGVITFQNSQGGAAVGTAGFYFGNVLAQADLAAAGGAGTPLDSWLTNVYGDLLADLPANLHANLTLDVNLGRIFWQFPDSAFSPGVFAGSTDVGLVTITSLTAVPEPSCLALAALAGACAAAVRARPAKPRRD